MNIDKVTIAYFSPTGNVQNVTRYIGRHIAQYFEAEIEEFDFLKPAMRMGTREIGADELLVIGVPVYAGRIPNRILPFIQSGFRAKRSICIPVVCFGNRNFDDGLSELAYEMRNSGFSVPGGAAVVTEHSFSNGIGEGRPDEDDLGEISSFTKRICEKVLAANDVSELDRAVMPGNTPPGPYYTPLKEDGTPANFLKSAVPVTDMGRCDRCMECVRRCPMDSIDDSDPSNITGICIKCQACIKCCGQKAKSFTDPEFLSHKKALAVNYSRRAENGFVISER